MICSRKVLVLNSSPMQHEKKKVLSRSGNKWHAGEMENHFLRTVSRKLIYILRSNYQKEFQRLNDPE